MTTADGATWRPQTRLRPGFAGRRAEPRKRAGHLQRKNQPRRALYCVRPEFPGPGVHAVREDMGLRFAFSRRRTNAKRKQGDLLLRIFALDEPHGAFRDLGVRDSELLFTYLDFEGELGARFGHLGVGPLLVH